MSEQELGKILIYQNEKGDTKIDVYFEEDTIWMSQKNLAQLYQTSPRKKLAASDVKQLEGHVERIAQEKKS